MSLSGHRKPHGRTLPNFCMLTVTVLWWRCDTLRTSGFVNDVMVSYDGPRGASCSKCNSRNYCIDSDQILLMIKTSKCTSWVLYWERTLNSLLEAYMYPTTATIRQTVQYRYCVTTATKLIDWVLTVYTVDE